MSLLKLLPWPVWMACLLAAGLLLLAACGGNDETSPPAETPPAEMLDGFATQPQQPAAAQKIQEEIFRPVDGVIETTTPDNFFTRNNLAVEAGESFTIEVTNAGENPHTLTIAGLDGEFGTADDIDTGTFRSGEEVSLEVTLDVAGTYVFRCEIHPTRMWGEITVGGG